MQSSTSTPQPAGQRFIAVYGLFILSCLVLIMVAIAWLTKNVDQSTAIAIDGAILTGNGLVTATQWQAAPGLVGSLQAIMEQFAAHIQALHAQQLAPTLAPLLEAPPSPVVPAPTLTKQGG